MAVADDREVKVLKQFESKPKRPSVGDKFILQTNSHIYPGRVISTTADAGFGSATCNLIYIFHPVADETAINDGTWNANNLILTPMMTNNLPWVRRYFKTIGHSPLRDTDKLQHHLFRNAFGKLYDETGVRSTQASAPIGIRGLDSYASIDARIEQYEEGGEMPQY